MNEVDAMQLMLEGARALAQVEANGVKVDVEELDRRLEQTDQEMKRLQADLRSDPLYKEWKKRFGDKANLGSGQQLGVILYDVLGYKCPERTETGLPKVDETALKGIGIPFTEKYLKAQKLKKLHSTFLSGLKKEVVNGKLHASYNLHTAVTFRSSSGADKDSGVKELNFQNLPVRIKENAEAIRSCFIPREGRVLVERDLSGIEVRVAACYNKDPTLIDYINDPSKDMHRDMAMECFMLSKEELGPTESGNPGKDTRYCSKNMFVFPQFYGSYYIDCARNMWEGIDVLNLHTYQEGAEKNRGITLKQHLKKKGIKELGILDCSKPPKKGSFENHIKSVEDRFWNTRFPVYTAWKKKWWENYKKKGEYYSLTGFPIRWSKMGFLSRNDCINYGVQCGAFHCLLWSLIKIQNWLNKYKMKTMLVGQIHDSLIADVHPNELQDYLDYSEKVMTQDIRKEWDWLIVPLAVEAEVTPINGSWHTKKEWVKKNGLWSSK